MSTPAPSFRTRLRDPLFLSGLLLTLLALTASGWVVQNGYVQDDFGVILANPLVRHWDGIWRAFGAAYWPGDDVKELYRPLSIAWFTPLWQAGQGAPFVYRLTSLLLYLVSVLAVWKLLRLLVTPGAAWVGAALFAVHPVHVEAVAVAVNQSELIVGTLLAYALMLRIRANRGEIPVSRAGPAILGLFLVAVFTKEHALVLPALLAAADHFLDRDRGSLMERLRTWRWNYAGLVVLAAFFWTIRGHVLGPGTGTLPAEALERSGMLQRAFTMAGVPAEWLRLLLWPAHLQADWNLLEWVPSRGWTLRETAGLAAVIAFLAGLAAAWRRRPTAAFGLAWMAVALAPVSNVLIPSGIILAERVLFLATIGFVIVVGDLYSSVEGRWATLPRPARLGLLLGTGVLLTLGVFRSALRYAGWHNRPITLAVGAADAPLSWRSQIAYGLLLSEAGDTTMSRVYIHRAIALRPDDPLVSKSMIDRIRINRGECRGAVIAYQEMLRYAPRRSDARGSLVACLVFMGRYPEARREAQRGVASGLDTAYFGYADRTADSAGRAGAPAGSVRLRAVGAKATLIGDPSHPDSAGALP